MSNRPADYTARRVAVNEVLSRPEERALADAAAAATRVRGSNAWRLLGLIKLAEANQDRRSPAALITKEEWDDKLDMSKGERTQALLRLLNELQPAAFARLLGVSDPWPTALCGPIGTPTETKVARLLREVDQREALEGYLAGAAAGGAVGGAGGTHLVARRAASTAIVPVEPHAARVAPCGAAQPVFHGGQDGAFGDDDTFFAQLDGMQAGLRAAHGAADWEATTHSSPARRAPSPAPPSVSPASPPFQIPPPARTLPSVPPGPISHAGSAAIAAAAAATASPLAPALPGPPPAQGSSSTGLVTAAIAAAAAATASAEAAATAAAAAAMAAREAAAAATAAVAAAVGAAAPLTPAGIAALVDQAREALKRNRVEGVVDAPAETPDSPQLCVSAGSDLLDCLMGVPPTCPVDRERSAPLPLFVTLTNEHDERRAASLACPAMRWRVQGADGAANGVCVAAPVVQRSRELPCYVRVGSWTPQDADGGNLNDFAADVPHAFVVHNEELRTSARCKVTFQELRPGLAELRNAARDLTVAWNNYKAAEAAEAADRALGASSAGGTPSPGSASGSASPLSSAAATSLAGSTEALLDVLCSVPLCDVASLSRRCGWEPIPMRAAALRHHVSRWRVCVHAFVSSGC